MKNQKGFIQIPILIAIIVGVFVVGGAGYVGIKQYQKNKVEKPQQETFAQNDQATSTTELSEVEKLRQEVEELKKQQSEIKSLPKSNVESKKIPTQTILPTPTKTSNSEPKEKENVWKYLVEGYASHSEWFRRNAESIRYGEEILDMKSRRNNLTRLLNDIRSTPFLSFSEGATFNTTLDLYGDAVEEEISHINQRLTAVEANLAQMDKYRAEFQKKVDLLLADSNKFRPKEDYDLFLQESLIWVDKRFENMGNINNIFSAYYQEIIDKIDQIQQITAVLNKEIIKLSSLTTTPTIPSRPEILSAPTPWVTQPPQTTRCTVSGDGGVGLQLYVNCTTSSF